MSGRKRENSSRIDRAFFDRPTLDVAGSLLGMRLVRELKGQRLVGRIVEVEAYVGGADSACHASRGRTERNCVMFGAPGHAYVYFTYGMHWLLNAVTEPEGFPAAVLFRALEPLEGLEGMRRRRNGCVDTELTSGPARLCQALAIERSFYGADLVDGDELYLERGQAVHSRDVETSSRVGIRYAAEKDILAPWRLFVKGNRHVSRGRPSVPGEGAPKRRRRDTA